jgi:hypothetical protein
VSRQQLRLLAYGVSEQDRESFVITRLVQALVIFATAAAALAAGKPR